jgi:hypothetical protein
LHFYDCYIPEIIDILKVMKAGNHNVETISMQLVLTLLSPLVVPQAENFVPGTETSKRAADHIHQCHLIVIKRTGHQEAKD